MKKIDSNLDLTKISLNDLYSNLKSNTYGITSYEARERLKEYGYNEIISKEKKGVFALLVSKLANPLVLMLIAVSLFAYFLGEQVNSLIIITMALLSIILSFVQEYNASRSIEKLESMVRITVKVIRNNIETKISLREIVPGDIVDLSPGKMIPADARIISSKNLYVNQSALTGESFPIKKSENIITAKINSAYELNHIGYMGSSIMSGSAKAIVIKSGKNTEFGKMAGTLQENIEKTAFQKGIHDFTWLMIKFTFVLVFFIFIVNVFLKNNITESLLFALAVAVGLTPEMLPMMVTINLSKGAIAMAKKMVIIKELESIQNFGAMDVFCTDKTGTLTMNKVVLIKHADVSGKENELVYKMAYLNSYYQSGMDNLLDLAVVKHKKFPLRNVIKIDEIPFDFMRKIVSVIIMEKSKYKLISKGAPEEIIKYCSHYLLNDKVSKINDKIIARINKLYDLFSSDGFRTLAVSFKELSPQESYPKADEKNLIFAGFIAFLDPPKPTAQQAISELERLGIQLKVLSGDNDLVTKKICSELKIPYKSTLIGKEIDKLEDGALKIKVEQANIFARLNPFQKERVIRAIRNNNHTVGFLGDGINDAPAIKAADVGISVDNATDIAKDTAQIILLKKDLTVLTSCVLEGRKTFANVIKYIKMGASSNFGNMLSMTGASIFLPFLPMLPPQILLNNLLYDFSQVSIPTDGVDNDYLLKPRPWNIKFIKEFMLYIGPISSIFDFATFGLMWYVFHATPELFHTGWFVESLATQILVIYIIRTSKTPFLQSNPSRSLVITTIAIVIFGAILPYIGLGSILGFQPLPTFFFLVLVIMVLTYLFLVEIAKKWFITKFGYE